MQGVCPFKGLEPFETGDAGIFFGRERLVDELVARLADAPLLAIIGPSGSGKSSLLRAGVLPALQREALVVRPSEWSAAELAKAIAQKATGHRFVLAVDQFEELFAGGVSEDERRALVLLALRADFVGHLARYGELADLASNQVLLGPMSKAELRRAGRRSSRGLRSTLSSSTPSSTMLRARPEGCRSSRRRSSSFGARGTDGS